jgi:hypothetical protein
MRVMPHQDGISNIMLSHVSFLSAPKPNRRRFAALS